jgi:hypothetical protein
MLTDKIKSIIKQFYNVAAVFSALGITDELW